MILIKTLLKVLRKIYSPLFFFPHKVAVKKPPTYKCMKKNSMKSFD